VGYAKMDSPRRVMEVWVFHGIVTGDFTEA